MNSNEDESKRYKEEIREEEKDRQMCGGEVKETVRDKENQHWWGGIRRAPPRG